MIKFIIVISIVIATACSDDSGEAPAVADAPSDVGLCLYQIKTLGHNCLVSTRARCSSALEYTGATYRSFGGLEYGDFIKTYKTCPDVGCTNEITNGVYSCPERVRPK